MIAAQPLQRAHPGQPLALPRGPEADLGNSETIHVERVATAVRSPGAGDVRGEQGDDARIVEVAPLDPHFFSAACAAASRAIGTR